MPASLFTSQSRILISRRFLVISASLRYSSRSSIAIMTSKKKIGTHSGSFHCDEVLGCYLLKQLPQYQDACIVRSRDPETLAGCDVVIDVGGVYDPATLRYDHHQRGFTQTMGDVRGESMPYSIKLSSAGLVYAHHGEEVISRVLTSRCADLPACSSAQTSVIYRKLYENFIMEIDAIDNGVSQYESDTPARYEINTNLSSRVARLNPEWDEASSPEDELTRFTAAMSVVGAELEQAVVYYARHWLPARSIVARALDKLDTSSRVSRQVLVLEKFCPWTSHLLELEQEAGITEPGRTLKYVLFQDKDASWRVRAVPLGTAKSFDLRVPLPAAWRGLRDQELSETSGISDCVFVHMSGFIGGCRTFESALQMATKSIQMHEQQQQQPTQADG